MNIPGSRLSGSGGGMKGGADYTTIDEYIRLQPKGVQQKLTALRKLIRQAAPDAQERIAYRMPTFHLNGNVVHFAAHTGHIGFYPTSSGIAHFQRELARYKTSKGAVQFPLEEPLPMKLIERIVKFRLEENSRKKR
jgi:uncharacterized protein YdhG (YjbR/CyaY superfamily)